METSEIGILLKSLCSLSACLDSFIHEVFGLYNNTSLPLAGGSCCSPEIRSHVDKSIIHAFIV